MQAGRCRLPQEVWLESLCAARDRKDKQVWGVEIRSSFLDILGVRRFLAKRPAQAGGWTPESGRKHVWGLGDLGGHQRTDGREALGLVRSPGGLGKQSKGPREQGPGRATRWGHPMCPGGTVTGQPAKSSGSS